MDAPTFFLAALTVYRISLMFTKENGPFHVFKKIRAKMPTAKAKEWVSCIFCFSMTVSAFVLAGIAWGGQPFVWFMYWCALSSITIMINQQFTKGDL